MTVQTVGKGVVVQGQGKDDEKMVLSSPSVSDNLDLVESPKKDNTGIGIAEGGKDDENIKPIVHFHKDLDDTSIQSTAKISDKDIKSDIGKRGSFDNSFVEKQGKSESNNKTKEKIEENIDNAVSKQKTDEVDVREQTEISPAMGEEVRSSEGEHTSK